MSLSICQVFINTAQNENSHNRKNEYSVENGTKIQQNAHMGGWNFFQSLCSNPKTDRNRAETTECGDKIYVHPLVKRSSSKLSEKSLEMCTESLGSETGSESGDEISLLVLEATPMIPTSPKPPQEENFLTRKRLIACSKSFPPPIKSISGSKNGYGGIRVKSFREDGRLVLQATRVSSYVSCFEAERSEGRLRLCFLSNSSLNDDNEVADIDELNSEWNEKEKEENESRDDQEEEFIEDGEDEKEEEAEEGIEENYEHIDGKIGTEKFRRMNERCKEGGSEQKGLLNWEQLWVAI